jgi:hypothetical protein
MQVKALTIDVANTFHDAEVSSVSHDPAASELSLTFTLPDSHVKTIYFRQVSAFRVADFVRQNVVSRVLMSTWHQFSDAELMKKVNWANSLSDTPIFLDEIHMVEYVRNIASGKWHLLIVEPSCGAEVVVIAEHIFLI